MEYNETFLKQHSFSETGSKRFINTIEEFKKELFEKSIDFGKANQEKGMPLEITSENVRSATINVKHTQIKQKPHILLIIANIFEYILTILATIGVSNMDKKWSIPLFGISLGVAVILITIRLMNRR